MAPFRSTSAFDSSNQLHQRFRPHFRLLYCWSVRFVPWPADDKFRLTCWITRCAHSWLYVCLGVTELRMTILTRWPGKSMSAASIHQVRQFRFPVPSMNPVFIEHVILWANSMALRKVTSGKVTGSREQRAKAFESKVANAKSHPVVVRLINIAFEVQIYFRSVIFTSNADEFMNSCDFLVRLFRARHLVVVRLTVWFTDASPLNSEFKVPMEAAYPFESQLKLTTTEPAVFSIYSQRWGLSVSQLINQSVSQSVSQSISQSMNFESQDDVGSFSSTSTLTPATWPALYT